MNRQLSMFAVSIMLMFSTIPVHGQSAAATYKQAGVTQFDRGNYVDALLNFQLATNEATRAGDQAGSLACQLRAAQALFKLGRYKEADANYAVVISSYERMYPDSIELAGALQSMGVSQDRQGNYALAESYLRRAVAIVEKVKPPGDIAQVQYLNQLALVLTHSARYHEAKQLAERAVATANQRSYSRAEALNTLASVTEKMGDYEQATPFFEEALSIVQELRGPDHPDVATMLNNSALNLTYRGHLSECEPIYRRVLEIDLKAFGPLHPLVAGTYNNMGLLAKALGKYGDAEADFKQALSIEEKSLGKEKPQYANTLSNLASLYLEQGRMEEAERYYTQALGTEERLSGANSPNVLSSLEGLARIAYLRGKNEQAKIQYQRAMTIAQSSLSQNAPQLIRIASGLQLASQPASTAHTVQNYSSPVKSNFSLGTKIRDRWALVLEVGSYKYNPTLNTFGRGGGQKFYQYLTEQAGFAKDHVLMLKDDQATRENIISALGDKFLPRVAKPDDLVVIYISTHGSPSQNDITGLNYLLAYDTKVDELYATGIPLQYISRTISERIRSRRAIVVIDSCHSGAATAGQASGVNAAELAQSTGQVVITSSRPNQQSCGWAKVSPMFTARFVEGLSQRGKATTLREAFDYAQVKVPTDSQLCKFTQNPVMVCGWPAENLQLANAMSAEVPITANSSTAPNTVPESWTRPQPSTSSAAPAPNAPADSDYDMVALQKYMTSIQPIIKANWNPPKAVQDKRITVLFSVNRQGAVERIRIDQSSGDAAGDRAAIAAIKLAAPFKPLPPRSPDFVDINFVFDYNVKQPPKKPATARRR